MSRVGPLAILIVITAPLAGCLGSSDANLGSESDNPVAEAISDCFWKNEVMTTIGCPKLIASAEFAQSKLWNLQVPSNATGFRFVYHLPLASAGEAEIAWQVGQTRHSSTFVGSVAPSEENTIGSDTDLEGGERTLSFVTDACNQTVLTADVQIVGVYQPLTVDLVAFLPGNFYNRFAEADPYDTSRVASCTNAYSRG